VKWKEQLKNLQTHAGRASTLTLLLDMKVCWSSTYNMLSHALQLREVCSFMIINYINLLINGYSISRISFTRLGVRSLISKNGQKLIS